MEGTSTGRLKSMNSYWCTSVSYPRVVSCEGMAALHCPFLCVQMSLCLDRGTESRQLLKALPRNYGGQRSNRQWWMRQKRRTWLKSSTWRVRPKSGCTSQEINTVRKFVLVCANNTYKHNLPLIGGWSFTSTACDNCDNICQPVIIYHIQHIC